MLYAVKRLALGIVLITLASAILLLADRGHRAAAGRKVQRVAILQHANTTVLEDGIRGTIDGLAARGFRDGDRIAIDRFNAQGDMPTGIAIARQVTAGDYDLVITSSTPSMQAVANNNRDGKVRHVFTLVADPFASGVGLDRANPLKHPPHMVGQGSFPPVDKAFQLARRMLPGLKLVGVAWNPAESNSLVFVKKAREVTAAMNLTLLEANVDNTSAVTDAINSLIARDAQAIWIGGDNTVIAGVNSVIAICRRMGVPVFTILPGTSRSSSSISGVSSNGSARPSSGSVEHHLSADDIAAVNLVLDEIVINIIAHGYDDQQEHRIDVSLALEGDLLTIQVEDDGKPFNPLEAPPPNLDLPIDERPIGGLGIHIVRSTVDAIEHRREGRRNILTMQKTMTGREGGQAEEGEEKR